MRRPSVLVFRTGQLGDTLIALPALDAIRRRHPAHRLILLTDRHDAQKGFVSSWDLVSRLVGFDEVLSYEPATGCVDTLRFAVPLAFRVRALAPARVYNLCSERSRRQLYRDAFFFGRLAGCRDYVALPEMLPYQAMDPRVSTPEWRLILESVGGAVTGAGVFSLPSRIPMDERRVAEAVLDRVGLLSVGGIVVAFGPGSKMPAKRWPIDRYVDVGRRLLAVDPRRSIVVLGGPEDRPLGDAICASLGDRVWNLAGKLSVLGSAVASERCALFVGNDTGTMHLAAMAGVRCVAIFSARDCPGKWSPIGDGHRILRCEVPCAGCMLEECIEKGNDCLLRISVDEVVSAVEDRLSQRSEATI